MILKPVNNICLAFNNNIGQGARCTNDYEITYCSCTAINWIERERGAVISIFLCYHVIILFMLQGSRQMRLQVSGGAVELAAPCTSEVGCLVG